MSEVLMWRIGDPCSICGETFASPAAFRAHLPHRACGCGALATRFVEGVGPCCDVHFPDEAVSRVERAAALRDAEALVVEAAIAYAQSKPPAVTCGRDPRDDGYNAGNALADAVVELLDLRAKEGGAG